MTPEELAAKLTGPAFAAMKERLMQRVTLIALRNSQLRTPVKTGALRRSETTRVEAQGARGYIGTNIEYAPFVHRRVPFFEQGIEDSRGEIEALMQQAGDEFMKDIAG